MSNGKYKVLVVDDEPSNLKLLGQILQDQYQLAFATDGLKTLDAACKIKPDIILLDIVMAGMDGYETCRRLKVDPETSKIPVIFVTAMGEMEDESRGFEVGGVDYITKPVKPLILKARIQTHLKLKSAREELEKQNAVMQENVRLREDIERITHHDLKSPLHGIINYPDLIMSEGNLSEQQRKHLQKIVQLGYRMMNMISLSLDLYKMEQGGYQLQPVPTDILPIIKDILQDNQKHIDAKGLTVKTTIDGRAVTKEDHFIIPGENLLFYTMLANLMKNAIEASPSKEEITISLAEDTGNSITIFNLGAVPVEIRDIFFEKYSTSGKTKGTGLGTYSAKLIAEIHGGRISLDTSDKEGTAVCINL